MKYLILNLLTFTAFFGFSQHVSQLEGTYQGKNIFVENPFSGDGDSFCVIKIEVNGEIYKPAKSSAAFEIDLTIFELKKGDPIFIRFTHKEDCSPRVLNIDALSDQSLRINSGSLKDGIMKWKNEFEDNYAHRVEQYRWNKWMKVDVTINTPGEDGYYSADLNGDLHSGVNTFRVVAENPIGMKAYSSNFTMQGSETPVTWKLINGNEEIEFTEETSWELYDEEGNLLDSGRGTNIKVQSAFGTVFYLKFDNYKSKIELK